MKDPRRGAPLSRRDALRLAAFASAAAWAPRLRAERITDTQVSRASEAGIPTDGRSDCTESLSAAINTGRIVDGEGATFVFRDAIAAGPKFKGLRNAHLVQTVPGDKANRAVHIKHALDFVLENVSLQRAGDGSGNGDIATIDRTGGLLIEKSTDFTTNDVTVTGGGIGSGIEILDCARFQAAGLQARDIFYHLPAHPLDDAINGILLTRCSDFKLLAPRAMNIGGTAASGSTHDNNRGVAISASRSFLVLDLRVSRVGQGLDITGSDGNSDFVVQNGLVEDCVTWGFKLANTARNGTIKNSIARRCGIGGFVISGSAEHNTPQTSSIVVDDCRAEEVLGNYARALESFGFGILAQRKIDPTYPRDILFRRCVAQTLDPSHQMQFGFRNDVPASLTQGQPNRVVGCKAEGFRKAATLGFSP